MNEQVISLKQASQTRLLGRCLAGLLAFNMLVVGLSFWTGVGRASLEVPEVSKVAPPAPASVEMAQGESQKSPVPAKVTPQSPPVAPSTSAGETASTTEPPVKSEIAVPVIEESAAPDAPIENNPLPKISPSPEQPRTEVIRLVNPGDTGGVVHYTLNGTAYSLSPGEFHEIATEAGYLVEFHRGGEFGFAKVPLQTGDNLFGVDDTGWRLIPGLSDPAVEIRRAY